MLIGNSLKCIFVKQKIKQLFVSSTSTIIIVRFMKRLFHKCRMFITFWIEEALALIISI